MLTGRDSLREIDENILRVQERVEWASRRLDELSSALHGRRFEQGRYYRELAKFRLDHIRAGRLVDRLDQTDRTVADLLDQKNRAVTVMESTFRNAEQKLQQLDQERNALEQTRNRVLEALLVKLEQSKARTEQSDAFRLQKEKTEKAFAVAERADEKASQAEAELDSKGKPYRDDPLFFYLWKRRYATPDYRHGGLIRSMDGWVAKQIGYKASMADYHMLNELPVQLRAHATRLKKIAQDHADQIQALEKLAAEEDGIPLIQSELETTEGKLARVDEDIAAEKNRHIQWVDQKTAFSAGTDRFTEQAIELQVADFEQENLESLYRDARQTPRPEDDVIVKQIQASRADIQGIENEINSIKAEQGGYRRTLNELEDLRLRFTRSRFDTTRSTFPGGFGLGALLGQILAGAMNSGTAWGEIQRHQKFEPPVPDFGGFGKGGFGSRGGFGGGRFGSGGGFGGGGFKTGGGF